DSAVAALDREAEEAEALGQFAQALELERRALALIRETPHDPLIVDSSLGNLSNAYEVAGEWDELRAICEERLALLPDIPTQRAERALVMETLGSAHLQLGHPAVAVEWLDKSIALYAQVASGDPTNARIGRIVALVDQGRYQEALVACEPFLPELVAATQPRPWRQGTIEWMLARTLWDEADAHQRSRAVTLAADAERDFLAGIEILDKYPSAAASLAIVRTRLAELRAWRARHRI
ncbi:MAG: hypothetical protein ABI678_19700, partial [Kofleriaceae bacterium]